jgi:hydrogenase expression/formation protein HypC
MCLSVPARIVELPGDPPHARAKVERAGVILEVDVSLLEAPAIGDHLLLHAGIAIGSYRPEEAQEALAVWADFARTSDELAREQPPQAKEK